jgi:hypothetical protein
VCFKYSPRSALRPRAGKPLGQQMRIGGDISFKKGLQFDLRRRRSAPMRASPARNPGWRLTACPCFPLRFFGAGTFSTAATTELLSGLVVLRQGLVVSPRPPMKVSSAPRKPVQRARRILAQPVAQLVRNGPGRLIRHAQFALQKIDTALVAAHQIGGEKPLCQIGSCPVKYRSSGRRFLPVAGRTFVYPWTRLQPATPDVRRTRHRRSRQASEMIDTLLLGTNLHYKLLSPAIDPPLISWAMLVV